MRFGGSFDYDAHAVSVGQGGVIPQAALDTPIPAGHIVQLVVEDIDTRRRVPNFTVECQLLLSCAIAKSSLPMWSLGRFSVSRQSLRQRAH